MFRPKSPATKLIKAGASLLLILFIAASLINQQYTKTTSQEESPQKETQHASNPIGDENTPFGQPQGGSPSDYILQNPYFTASYNNSLGGPNWVAWKLVAKNIGDTPRSPFYTDPNLPQNFNHITPEDYSNSGFDRGHQCNHADRSSSPTASQATFSMANMLPQAPNLNRKTWKHLEEYCRKLAKRGKTLYIVCGCSGTGGEGEKGPKSTIKNKINVPANCWKIIQITNGETTPNQTWETIAVNIPNTQSVNPNWKTYLTTVENIESITGLKFFPNIKNANQ